MAEKIGGSARMGAHFEASRVHTGVGRCDLAAQLGHSDETIRLNTTVGERIAKRRVGSERRRARGDSAVAMIEFAIVLPVLAVLVFGTVDLGRAYQLKNQLKNAAREGAAYAQVYPDRQVANAGNCQNPANILFRAQNELSGGGTGFTIEASPPGSDIPGPLTGCETLTGYDPGEDITITASKDFDVITPLVGAITGDPIEVTESVTVVIQG